MKIALIKLGARLSYKSRGTSGGIGESLAIIELLKIAGVEVHIYTKKPDDLIYNGVYFHDLKEHEKINDFNYDSLLIMNGSINFFGGAETVEEMSNLWIINNFKGNVFYIFCDPNLLLKQIYGSIEKKEWGNKYKKENIEIIRKDITCICQSRRIDLIQKMHEKGNVFFKKIVHYPFEKFPLITFKDENINDDLQWDILYGGTFRGGRREKDMVKFFFGYPDNIKVQMFGKIELSQFHTKLIEKQQEPSFGEPVKYTNYNNKMKTGLSTIIIGDEFYKKLDIAAQRVYESIQIGNIVFIDESYDKNKIIFKNNFLKNFSYVNNKEDVIKRLNILKQHNYKEIIKLQKEDTKIDKQEYCNNFKNLLMEN
ncbi:hypothetical protein M0Q97_09245 [Candidatus Dojkabacteria bacterium]|jgi:hypothetical protein|nr:hypothetical protein [Candidatus Dojkabacteria bacterium]